MSNKESKLETTYVTAYTKTDYEKDEKIFDKSIKTGNVDFGSFKRLMMRDLCVNSKILETISFNLLYIFFIEILIYYTY